MIGWITGALTLAGRIAKAYEAKENAKTDRDRIAADIRIKQLEARARVQAGSRIDATIRAVIGLVVASFLFKVVTWDKVFALGSTDNLSPQLWWVVTVVVGFYFLDTTVSRFKG